MNIKYYLVLPYIVAFGVSLIPVIILYLLFGQMSYFGLEGVWKGMVAGGPIAAYVFLYMATLKHMLRASSLILDEGPISQIEEAESTQGVPISGRWLASWPWYSPKTQKTIDWKETLTIEQKGRHVFGTIVDEDGQNSEIRGAVFGRMLTFYYVSTGNSRLSCGSATLGIDPVAKTMRGHQVYYDLEEAKLKHTEYSMELLPD